MALLEVRNISKRFSRGKTSVAALNNISFEINSGESLGLVGESRLRQKYNSRNNRKAHKGRQRRNIF